MGWRGFWCVGLWFGLGISFGLGVGLTWYSVGLWLGISGVWVWVSFLDGCLVRLVGMVVVLVWVWVVWVGL